MSLRWSTRIYQLFLLLLTGICIFISSQFLPTILEKRQKYQLTQNHPLENAPPQLVIATTALGGLRGFMIDYLWLRATELRNKGSHYEIVQLYDWISKLEPRIPEVWSYIAWEMAYNISETMYSPDDRWRWIYKGMCQLRDHGIIYNQNTPHLYWELAFMIYNKIDVNAIQQYKHYFGLKWFQFWNEVLGSEFDIEAIVQAPATLEILLKDTFVVQFLEESKKHANFDMLADFYNISNLSEEAKSKLDEITKQEKYATAIPKIIAYIISQRLQKEFKMQPQKMLSMTQKYGKIDWRLPSAHSLYWAEEGLAAFGRLKANPSKKLSNVNMETLERNLDRVQHTALQQIFEYGTFLVMTPQRLVCIPNFTVLDSLQELCENIQKKWGLEKGRESHETFLRRAIGKCYMHNRSEQAKKYFEILKKKFPNNPEYRQDIDTFIVQDVGRTVNFAQPHVVEEYLIRSQADAYRSLLESNYEKYNGLTHIIALIYRRYLERHDQNFDNEYLKPRTMEYIQKSAYRNLIRDTEVMYGKEKSATIWNSIEKKFPIFAKLRELKE